MTQTHHNDQNKTRKSRKRYNTQLNKFRTILWLESIFEEFLLSKDELQTIIMNISCDSSNIVYKWLSRKHSATPNSVDNIAKKLPGSEFIYYFPIFQLLENKPLTNADLEKIIKPYIIPENPRIWAFPDNIENTNSFKPTPDIQEDDYETLIERGDIYGLVGILYLVRKAELKNDVFMHARYLKAAYRAFPAFCRYKHFKKRWPEFYDALEIVSGRLIMSTSLVVPVKYIIENQINAPDHITKRSLRPRDPITMRFTQLELPYIEATY